MKKTEKKSPTSGGRVVRWSYCAGRGGDLQGVMVLTDAEWSELRAAFKVGERVYLGEVCGKHSEVIVTLAESQFETLATKPGEVNAVRRVLPGGAGFNIHNALVFGREEREAAE